MRTIDPEILKTLLIDYRKKKHLSQRQLGEMIDVPGFTICRWENGMHNITPAMLKLLRLAKIIDDGDLKKMGVKVT